MSIRAYIRRRKYIWVNEDAGFFQYNNDGENLTNYVHTEHEFCINVSFQNKLLDLIFEYGAKDYRNQNSIGEIEISKVEFESMFQNEKREWSQKDWESIRKIKKYFEEDWDWLILTCY